MVLGMVVHIMFCDNVVIGEVCMSNKRDTTGSGSIEFPQLPPPALFHVYYERLQNFHLEITIQ